MGTRNLTCVFVDGEYKVAQYGQWDGYPEGQGKTALEFLRNDMRENRFLENVRKCTFAPADQLEALWKDNPRFSRDHGADILTIIQNCDGGLLLRNEIDFAGDSLMCEWAYVIDFDHNSFEIYEGFNKSPLPDDARFAKSPRAGNEYFPVRLVKAYPLDDLPTVDVFIADLCSAEEEEEA